MKLKILLSFINICNVSGKAEKINKPEIISIFQINDFFRSKQHTSFLSPLFPTIITYIYHPLLKGTNTTYYISTSFSLKCNLYMLICIILYMCIYIYRVSHFTFFLVTISKIGVVIIQKYPRKLFYFFHIERII